MKITSISAQTRNPDRVNVSVDGTYRFSLDIFQLTDLGVKVGREYSEAELTELETESQFGKLYTRALEYTMLRPHSAKEIRDYLWRKTRPKKVLKHTSRREGSTFTSKAADTTVEIPGVSQALADRVYDRLVDKGYIDDEKFARWWIENRNQRKGASQRKLTAELRQKGVDQSIINRQLADSERTDADELQKVIAKKAGRYADRQKLVQYLMRQGFTYDAIQTALVDESDDR